MKIIRCSILAMATLASSVTLGVAQAAITLPPSIAKSKTLRICSAINLPPMEFMSPQTQPEGVDIDLANAISKKLGLKTKFINMPFAGLIPALLADHCDVIMSQLFIKKIAPEGDR